MKRIIYRIEDNCGIKVSEEAAEKLLKSKDFQESPVKRPYKKTIELTKEEEELLFGKKKQSKSKKAS